MSRLKEEKRACVAFAEFRQTYAAETIGRPALAMNRREPIGLLTIGTGWSNPYPVEEDCI